MRRFRLRATLLATAVIVTALAVSGCGGPDKRDLETLRAAIRATRTSLSGFVYSEISGDRSVEVRGLRNDDFRYEARLSVNKKPALDEIVADDAIADRVLDPSALGIYAATGLPASVDKEDANGISVREAFATRRWVVDEDGAPDLLAVRDLKKDQGLDPIYDALSVLDYLDTAVLRETQVVKYDKFDYDYKPSEDPFPTPEKGSGVDRYDIRPPRLPKASDAAGGNQPVPATLHFRKLVVYVKDGKVLQVLESIDVIGRLDDIRRAYDIDFPEGISNDEAADIAIDAINAVRKGQGDDPIRVRSMAITYSDDTHDVTLPTVGAVAGDLSVLAFRGKSKASQGTGTERTTGS